MLEKKIINKNSANDLVNLVISLDKQQNIKK